ncbi:MAG: cysteine-rich CWC family protein [Desulfuromonadales bacterium]|nr:cysteine-rich CWC family protein [Desulfuromonadales bacterium]MBN2791887.1 cysteine-rich CWC family protein [Desulfuromonadales bacterium]
MNQAIDTTICPLCGQANGCLAADHQSCWCNDINIPQALIDLIPDHLKRKACICRPCIEHFHQDPEHFSSLHQGSEQ